MTPASVVPLAAARQLLLFEGCSGGAGQPCVEAAGRVHAKLIAVLGPLLGVAGVQAILARSVKLATGSRVDATAGSIDALHVLLEARGPDEVATTATLVLSAFLSLVTEFIGAELTTAVLRRSWPALGTSTSEESTS